MPKNIYISLKLESVNYSMSLDLSPGYYHTRLNKDANNLCTGIITWGKYHYKNLPIGFSNSLDIYKQKINYLFQGSEPIRGYIDKYFITTKGYCTD